MPEKLSRKPSAKNVTQMFAGAAALTLLMGGGLVFWLCGSLSAEKAKQTNLQAQVGSSEKIAKRLQDTQALYDQTSRKIAVLETSVTQKSYVPTLLQQIQNLAGETDLSITNMHPGPVAAPAAPAAPAKTAGGDSASAGGDSASAGAKKPAAAPTYSTMDVELNVTGTYADTARFVYGLTSFPKIMSVVSVQMSPGQSGPSATAPQVSTALKLTAYIFPDDAADPAPSVADPGPRAVKNTAPQTSSPALPAADGRATDAARVL